MQTVVQQDPAPAAVPVEQQHTAPSASVESDEPDELVAEDVEDSIREIFSSVTFSSSNDSSFLVDAIDGLLEQQLGRAISGNVTDVISSSSLPAQQLFFSPEDSRPVPLLSVDLLSFESPEVIRSASLSSPSLAFFIAEQVTLTFNNTSTPRSLHRPANRASRRVRSLRSLTCRTVQWKCTRRTHPG